MCVFFPGQVSLGRIDTLKIDKMIGPRRSGVYMSVYLFTSSVLSGGIHM